MLADASRCIDDTVWRPVIVPFESSGVRLYRPPGFGALMTYIAIGPALVHCSVWSYVTPGITCVGRAAADGARISPKMTAVASLRTIGPRFTVAETAA